MRFRRLPRNAAKSTLTRRLPNRFVRQAAGLQRSRCREAHGAESARQVDCRNSKSQRGTVTFLATHASGRPSAARSSFAGNGKTEAP
jgi:hypothetical protein